MINTAALFSDFFAPRSASANCLQIKAASAIAAGRTPRRGKNEGEGGGEGRGG